jgi:hypothetical protein
MAAALYAMAFLLESALAVRSGFKSASPGIACSHRQPAGPACHQYFALPQRRDFPQSPLSRVFGGTTAHPARQPENSFVTVPAVIAELQTGWRRLLAVALAVGTLGAVAVSGCGEKSEPAVHPPTTAATTTTPPATTTTPATTTPPATTVKPATPTAPVPKTTP